jgi:hypothetical protein
VTPGVEMQACEIALRLVNAGWNHSGAPAGALCSDVRSVLFRKRWVMQSVVPKLRTITNSARRRDSSVTTSPAMPSEKYSCSGSLLTSTLIASKNYRDASLIIGRGHPTDLPPVAENLCTEMVCQLVCGPMQRLMIIIANDNRERPTYQAATDKLDLMTWHDCPPLWDGQEELVVSQRRRPGSNSQPTIRANCSLRTKSASSLASKARFALSPHSAKLKDMASRERNQTSYAASRVHIIEPMVAANYRLMLTGTDNTTWSEPETWRADQQDLRLCVAKHGSQLD